MSARMASSRTLWQASSITWTNYQFYDTTSLHCKLNYSILIFCSLRTCSAWLSLTRSSVVIPSYKRYKVSHENHGKISCTRISLQLYIGFICCQGIYFNPIDRFCRTSSSCSSRNEESCQEKDDKFSFKKEKKSKVTRSHYAIGVSLVEFLVERQLITLKT